MSGKPWGEPYFNTPVNDDHPVLFTFDNGAWRKVVIDALSSYGIINLCGCDANGDLWLRCRDETTGAQLAFYRFTPETGDLVRVDLSPVNVVYYFAFEDDGTVWMIGGVHKDYVTRNGQLIRYGKNGEITSYLLKRADERPYKGPNFNFPDYVGGICCDNRGSVWLWHDRDGMYRFKNGEWNRYTQESGHLQSNFTNDAAFGPDGRLWIVTNSGISVFDTNTGVDDDTGLNPETVPAIGNYPNPFNPSTTVSFTLPSDTHATLKVYNLAGQTVRTLVDNRLRAGLHSIVWNGTDDSGNPVAAGVYLSRLTYDTSVVTGRMVLIK